MTYYAQVQDAVEFIKRRAPQPDVAIVLGSGLGDFADGLANAVTMPYDTLPHWPQSLTTSS